MADFTEKTDRPGSLGVPSVTEAPATPAPPIGPPTPTMDVDTGLPWAVEGETLAAENIERREGN